MCAVYVVVCGGLPGVEIHTVDKIVLSLGIEVSTEQFFDAHYLMRNLASLFGIPNGRMRVPNVVAGTSRRRRLQAGSTTAITVEIDRASACDDVACGPNGYCYEGEQGASCLCNTGWVTPSTCGGDTACTCSAPACAADCANCTIEAPIAPRAPARSRCSWEVAASRAARRGSTPTLQERADSAAPPASPASAARGQIAPAAPPSACAPTSQRARPRASAAAPSAAPLGSTPTQSASASRATRAAAPRAQARGARSVRRASTSAHRESDPQPFSPPAR